MAKEPDEDVKREDVTREDEMRAEARYNARMRAALLEANEALRRENATLNGTIGELLRESETAKPRRFETLVVEVVDPAVYDAHNPMNAAIPGARVSAWSMGHRLDVHNLMYDKIEAFCDRDCDHRDCCEEYPLQAAKQAWGAA